MEQIQIEYSEEDDRINPTTDIDPDDNDPRDYDLLYKDGEL